MFFYKNFRLNGHTISIWNFRIKGRSFHGLCTNKKSSLFDSFPNFGIPCFIRTNTEQKIFGRK